MKNLITSLTIATTLLVSGVSVVSADTSAGYGAPCTPSYGNPCEVPGVVSMNKMVLDPKSTTKGGQEVFVENLTASNNHYAPDQAAAFKLIVTNTGTKTLTHVEVRDIFPKEVLFVSGDGKFQNGVFTTTINELKPGEKREIVIRGKIIGTSQLPNQNLLCNITNRAQAIAEGKTAEDNAQLCVEKTTPVYPAPKAKETPKTGPEMLALIGLIPGVASGLLLRKKAIRN